jgi:hypothetical protein
MLQLLKVYLKSLCFQKRSLLARRNYGVELNFLLVYAAGFHPSLRAKEEVVEEGGER